MKDLKGTCLLLLLLLLLSTTHSKAIIFDKYFVPNTLRVDFFFTGDSAGQQIIWHKLKKEKFWAGSKTNLIDTLRYGGYLFEVINSDTDELIFSRGFSSLFEEWLTTDEAKKMKRSFEHTIVFPFPRVSVELKIYYRNRANEFIFMASKEINPEDYFINMEVKEARSDSVLKSGDPSKKVDIVFLAEGYTIEEMPKFRDDVKRFTDGLFLKEPFTSYKNYFNIWMVESVSDDSGSDQPKEGIWRSTVFNSSFSTFGSYRYLTSMSVFNIRDYASVVPYDYICVIVNSKRYGGGGIYNDYIIGTSDNEHSIFVFVHELGHGFAGLGDEYYTSSVAYSDFFNLEVEPWPPNLTTLIDFDKKWKNMLDQGTPIPTPATPDFNNKVGVYEGGGYVAKGVYRPFFNCVMHKRGTKEFCPVCKQAIVKSILQNCN